MDYSKHVSTKQTPQSRPIPGRKDMVENNAGGFVFGVDKWERLNRFLILGSEGGTYYVGERELTEQNAQIVTECVRDDGPRTVATITGVSKEGRAPKNDPAIFALALAATYGNEATKRLAYNNIPEVCRIGTHLFTFCQAIQNLRGWSRGLRRGVSRFYTSRTDRELAQQLIKYRQRNGWTHRDVLRLAHTKPGDGERNDILRWAVGKPPERSAGKIIEAFERVQKADWKTAIPLIEEFQLPREALPTELLKRKEIWEALLHKMPMTAMIRNLGVMSNVELLRTNLDAAVGTVAERLRNAELIKKARVHPMQILMALKTYEAGRGFRGKQTWQPVPAILDALDDAFYLSFDNVEPTGKAVFIGLDVSGSMGSAMQNSNLTCRDASAALCMVTMRSESRHVIAGFSEQLVPLHLTPKMRLNEVIQKISGLPFGGTDCALPMLTAIHNKLEVDTFIVYTDNETWAGNVHPKQALDQYRQRFGRDAKLIVVGMTATEFSIADPKDSGMLDVVGFDTSVPTVMADFMRNS